MADENKIGNFIDFLIKLVFDPYEMDKVCRITGILLLLFCMLLFSCGLSPTHIISTLFLLCGIILLIAPEYFYVPIIIVGSGIIFFIISIYISSKKCNINN